MPKIIDPDEILLNKRADLSVDFFRVSVAHTREIMKITIPQREEWREMPDGWLAFRIYGALGDPEGSSELQIPPEYWSKKQKQ